MLSLNGNTAPYMLYAYARICGIVRKATGQSEDERLEWPETASEICITHDSEKQLIRNLVKLPDILSEVESELYPNRLCDYLFETSQKFNKVRSYCVCVIDLSQYEIILSTFSLRVCSYYIVCSSNYYLCQHSVFSSMKTAQ